MFLPRRSKHTRLPYFCVGPFFTFISASSSEARLAVYVDVPKQHRSTGQTVLLKDLYPEAQSDYGVDCICFVAIASSEWVAK